MATKGRYTNLLRKVIGNNFNTSDFQDAIKIYNKCIDMNYFNVTMLYVNQEWRPEFDTSETTLYKKSINLKDRDKWECIIQLMDAIQEEEFIAVEDTNGQQMYRHERLNINETETYNGQFKY